MTEEQQRIAIAEACGWKNVDAGAGRVWGFTTRHKGTPSESDVCVDVPNYLNDLNAMHEAERTMGDPQLWDEYQSYLSDAMRNIGWIYHATAAQRAEAFLKTIGKWEAQ